MKTPWIIAIRPTPAVLEKHGQPASTVEVYEPIRWWTSSAGESGLNYFLFMQMDDGPAVRWSFDLIDQLTITRRTEGGQ